MEENKIAKTPEKINVLALISYLGIFCFVPLILKKDDEFVNFHAKQGLTLFIAEIAASIWSVVPFIGWMTSWLVWIFLLVLTCIGLYNAFSGHKKELPLIGKYSEKFTI